MSLPIWWLFGFNCVHLLFWFASSVLFCLSVFLSAIWILKFLPEVLSDLVFRFGCTFAARLPHDRRSASISPIIEEVFIIRYVSLIIHHNSFTALLLHTNIAAATIITTSRVSSMTNTTHNSNTVHSRAAAQQPKSSEMITQKIKGTCKKNRAQFDKLENKKHNFGLGSLRARGGRG